MRALYTWYIYIVYIYIYIYAIHAYMDSHV